jgi:hypothetical protein
MYYMSAALASSGHKPRGMRPGNELNCVHFYGSRVARQNAVEAENHTKSRIVPPGDADV